MRMNRWMPLGLGVGLGLALVFLTSRGAIDAQEKKPAADEENPFAGKILVIYQKSDPNGTAHTLEGVVITEYKGLRVLAGKGVEREGDWTAGLKTRIALDNVASIIQFDDLKTFKERFEEDDSRRTASR